MIGQWLEDDLGQEQSARSALDNKSLLTCWLVTELLANSFTFFVVKIVVVIFDDHNIKTKIATIV